MIADHGLGEVFGARLRLNVDCVVKICGTRDLIYTRVAWVMLFLTASHHNIRVCRNLGHIWHVGTYVSYSKSW